MPYFALTEVCGPSWDPSRGRREQDGWDEHAAFMDGLVDEGFVILGGPIGDGERVLLLLQAEDEREIESRLADDPWLPDGVLSVEKIEPWSIWLGRSRVESGDLTRRRSASTASSSTPTSCSRTT